MKKNTTRKYLLLGLAALILATLACNGAAVPPGLNDTPTAIAPATATPVVESTATPGTLPTQTPIVATTNTPAPTTTVTNTNPFNGEVYESDVAGQSYDYRWDNWTLWMPWLPKAPDPGQLKANMTDDMKIKAMDTNYIWYGVACTMSLDTNHDGKYGDKFQADDPGDNAGYQMTDRINGGNTVRFIVPKDSTDGFAFLKSDCKESDSTGSLVVLEAAIGK